MQVFRQPGANIIGTVNRIRQALPALEASIPGGNQRHGQQGPNRLRSDPRSTRSNAPCSSPSSLVIMVVFVFLRNPRATLIPSVAVPVSLIGTFGVMYLFGYSIDNLSLMALTISTGFVVDDAIVVIENITRHIEQGMHPVEAAFHGAQEIGFTVLSMTTSLVARIYPDFVDGRASLAACSANLRSHLPWRFWFRFSFPSR